MVDVKRYIGIDVAKAQLDVALGPNGERFAVANDERGISALLKRLEPADLVIIEATGGLEVAARLRKSLSSTKILVTTMHDSEEMLRAAAATGVAGYLLKSDAEQCLVKALKAVHSGEPFISPSFDPAVVSAVRELFW